jgi:cleavage and polyadenylation specificity factor subunit 3
MMRLKSKLLSLNANLAAEAKVKVYSPRNCEELRIPFRTERVAKVVGKLAAMAPGEAGADAMIHGVLVESDFKLSLMAAEDLREYAGLVTTVVTCKQRLRLSAAGVGLIGWALESMFGSVEAAEGKVAEGEVAEGEAGSDSGGPRTFTVMGCVRVSCRARGLVEVSWEGNILNDGVADAVMAVLMAVESSPASVRQSGHGHAGHAHGHADGLAHKAKGASVHANASAQQRLDRLYLFLEAQFGADALTPIVEPRGEARAAAAAAAEAVEAAEAAVEAPAVEAAAAAADESARELQRLQRLGIPVPGIEIRVERLAARVWLEDLAVESASRAFGERVRAVLERAVEVVAPLWA